MTILRTGTSRQYSENWAKAFGEKKAKVTAAAGKKSAKKKRTTRGKPAKK